MQNPSTQDDQDNRIISEEECAAIIRDFETRIIDLEKTLERNRLVLSIFMIIVCIWTVFTILVFMIRLQENTDHIIKIKRLIYGQSE